MAPPLVARPAVHAGLSLPERRLRWRGRSPGRSPSAVRSLQKMTAALAQLITPDRRTALVVRAQAHLRTPDSARSPSPDPTTYPSTGDPEHRQTTLSRQSRTLTTDTHPKKINRRDARSQCGRYERSRLDLPQMD